MSDSLTDLESGNWIKRGWFILINFLSCNRYDSWGGVIQVHGPLVCDTYTRRKCYSTRTTWVSRGYNVSQMVLGPP